MAKKREPKFTIAPLDWQHSYDETWRASTPFGSYEVARTEGRGWHWGYCFDEYYDENDYGCDGLEDGKAKAWANWLERISGALTPAQPPGASDTKESK